MKTTLALVQDPADLLSTSKAIPVKMWLYPADVNDSTEGVRFGFVEAGRAGELREHLDDSVALTEAL